MFFFFEQKTADEMRISDWSSDVCSSDLYSLLLIVLLARPQGLLGKRTLEALGGAGAAGGSMPTTSLLAAGSSSQRGRHAVLFLRPRWLVLLGAALALVPLLVDDSYLLQAFLYGLIRSEEHTSELQSLMRISYAVFCLKKKTT